MSSKNANVRRFGTVSGVFLPCILSLFGVILFLRTGWVVGNAGPLKSILILIIASFIAFCTGLSVASISTNMDVGTGGTYYIIARNLGLDIGGAIGIPLYFSQAASIAFYIIGWLESVSFIKTGISFPLWGTIILMAFSFLVFIGADLAVNFQYIIAFVLFLGIASFLITPWKKPLSINIWAHYTHGYNFWKVFAVFFPALVGIDAGIGLSGELKDPKDNIPKGVISALIFSTLIYAIIMYKASTLAPYEVLIKHTDLFIKDSYSPFIVIMGIWAATLSSALTYSVAAPRTLKALSEDGILPKIFASSLGSTKGEPRIGVLITFCLAELFILSSSLNRIAAIISISFLISYATLNLASSLYSLIDSPTYRPIFKIHWIVSMLGFLLSVAAMFFIHPFSAPLVILFIFSIYLALKRKHIIQTWGDVRTGMWISLSRFALIQLEKFQLNVMDWRPNIMVFSINPKTRFHLSQFAYWLSYGNGIVTLCNLIVGDFSRSYQERNLRFIELKRFVQSNKWPLFVEVAIVQDLNRDIPIILQSYGIGNIYPNSVLFGWGYNPKEENLVMRLIRSIAYINKDIFILKFDPIYGFGSFKSIDIWWGGKGGNIGLMLLVADILKKSEPWRHANIRIIQAIKNKDILEIAYTDISNLLQKIRIEAEIKIVVDKDIESNLSSIIKEYSSDKDLVIMGLPIPQKGKEKEVAYRINNLILPLRSVLMIRSIMEKDFFI